MDLYTYAHYIYNKGLNIEELENSNSLQRLFYTASMMVIKEEDTKNQISLMTTLAKLVNPRIPNDIINKMLNYKK